MELEVLAGIGAAAVVGAGAAAVVGAGATAWTTSSASSASTCGGWHPDSIAKVVNRIADLQSVFFTGVSQNYFVSLDFYVMDSSKILFGWFTRLLCTNRPNAIATSPNGRHLSVIDHFLG
ncbi:MAG: hypothetical protein ABJ263_10830 [Tateyamaria sp.]|uniref:hypothetical protein n=1 Tax=Tateyamaria sp. TaxID=1929288 RepID=UPI003268B84E